MTRRSLVLLALLGGAGAACDYPTSPPMWDQIWVVPGETIEIGVAELLPDGIGVNADTTAFVADVPGSSLVFSVAAMCGAPCEPFYGVPDQPKPAFEQTLQTSVSLPGDLVSATLAGGSLPLEMTHSFQFDPLRPTADPAGWTGHIAVRVISDGVLVAEDSIHGEETAFAPGTTLSPSLEIQPVTVTPELTIEISFYSPDGDPTTVERDDSLSVTLQPGTVEATEVTVAAASISVDPVITTLDFSGIEADGFVVEQVRSGAFMFDIHNPFAVTGTLDVTFDLNTTTLDRTVPIQPGDYEARLDFSGAELAWMLGSDAVDVVASGSVTAPEGTVTVTPSQTLVIENELELVLQVGSSEDGP